jgi:anti-anti-sigma regulatory factor
LIAPLLAEAPAPQLSTALEADWACTWLNLEGDLVESTIPGFEEAMSDALKLGRRKIVLVTAGVSRADGEGIASIDRARKLAKSRGIKFAVRAFGRARGPWWLGLGLRPSGYNPLKFIRAESG